MRLKGLVLHPQSYEVLDKAAPELNLQRVQAAYDSHKLLLRNRSAQLRPSLTKVKNEELLRAMQRHNAFFIYKRKGLILKGHESRVEDLKSKTMQHFCEFNSVKSKMVKIDLKAVKYKHEIMAYFNNPKDHLPKFLKRSLAPDSLLAEPEQDFPRAPDRPLPYRRKKSLPPPAPKQGGSKQQPNLHTQKQKQQQHYRAGSSNLRTIRSAFRLPTPVTRSRNTAAPQPVTQSQAQQAYFSNERLRQSLHPRLKSSNSTSTFLTQVVPQRRGGVGVGSIRPQQRLSFADLIKQEHEAEAARSRNELKKKFSYAGNQSRKYAMEEYESNKKLITDVPGVYLRSTSNNVRELHNFQQFFESNTSKAKNLVRLCQYRAKQAPQPRRCQSAPRVGVGVTTARSVATPARPRRHQSVDFRMRETESKLTSTVHCETSSWVSRAKMVRSLRKGGGDSPSNQSTADFQSLVVTGTNNSRAVSPYKLPAGQL